MESPGSSGGRLTRSEILALDVATTTGYYSLHGSGAWRFYHATRHRRTYLAFYRTLRGVRPPAWHTAHREPKT